MIFRGIIQLKDDESLRVAFQTASGSATDGIDYGSTQTIEVPIYDETYKESDEKYHNLITNNYKNLNKQDIMTDILKKVA